MSNSGTVSLQKYRRLQIIAVVLLAVSVFLGITVFAQSTGAEAEPAAQATEPGARGAAAQPAYIRGDADDPMAIGDPDAPLVLVEWTDMRCPFCASFSRDTMPQILEEYVESGEVRIEVNDVAFFGDESAAAAVAARAAGEQGRYFEYLEALYGAAPESGHPDMPREKLMGFAEQAGVPDLAAFADDLDDPALLEAVEASTARAQQLGVNSVPFFAAGGTTLSGAQPFAQFRGFLDGALQQAGASAPR